MIADQLERQLLKEQPLTIRVTCVGMVYDLRVHPSDVQHGNENCKWPVTALSCHTVRLAEFMSSVHTTFCAVIESHDVWFGLVNSV